MQKLNCAVVNVWYHDEVVKRCSTLVESMPERVNYSSKGWSYVCVIDMINKWSPYEKIYTLFGRVGILCTYRLKSVRHRMELCGTPF